MSREELVWRAGVAARTAAQRLEMRVNPPRWNRSDLGQVLADGVCTEPDGLADAIRARGSRFVLDPAHAEHVARAIRECWPSAAAQAAERADRVLKGEYDVLGYRALSFTPSGAIDWHLDPVHGRRAPQAFWADVPYLDPSIGDHKIIWELNRHQHWLQLGRALWLTRDARYARGIVSLLESWMAANPPLTGINWASMLEIGFRGMSWTWALHFLLADDRTGQPWLVDLLIGLDRQMTHLEQNLSYYFSPNTHLTGEALALYVVGAALPELRGSARWIETGRRILLEEIERQILPDGGHAERSTHYQRYTLDFYLLACLTARQIGDGSAGARFAAATTRLAEYTRTMADDQGRLPVIGDDDGGMLWPITGRACDDVRDSLALAALLLGRPDLAPWGPCEELLWLDGRDALADASLVDAHRADPRPSRTLEHTGYVVLRDEHGGHAVFDTGAHGYLNGGHAHADALALTLSLDGRPLLIDPGTSTYTMDGRLRDHLRSSLSHNTVTIDDQSQSRPSGPFHWQTRADAALHGSRHNPAFDWAEGSHDGYAPLVHRRAVIRTAGAGWLVVDDISGEGQHKIDACWHFDPRWMLVCDVPGRLRATHLEGGAAWLLHDGCNVALMLGDEDTGLGWSAPVYGTLLPTWTARVTREGVLPIRMVTWIGAAVDGEPAPVLERFVPECDERARAVGVRVRRGDTTSTFALLLDEPAMREGRAIGTGDFQTDARVIHYTERAGRLLALDLVDASHALALREDWITDRAQPISLSTTPSQVTVRASPNPASPSLAASVLFSPNR